MDVWEVFWITTGATVAAAILIAVGNRLWNHRHTPAGWLAQGIVWIRALGRNRGEVRRRRLCGEVLQRAEALGIEVIVQVRGSNPVRVTHHPTARVFSLYSDLPSYRAAGERGEHTGSNAHWGRPPPPIKRWTEEQLRQWLAGHPAA